MYVTSLITECDVVEGRKYKVTAESETEKGVLYVIDGVGDEYALLVGEYELSPDEPSYKQAYLEFHNKTEWVQETATTKEWGMHRADILRERIEALQEENAELKSRIASLEK